MRVLEVGPVTEGDGRRRIKSGGVLGQVEQVTSHEHDFCQLLMSAMR